MLSGLVKVGSPRLSSLHFAALFVLALFVWLSSTRSLLSSAIHGMLFEFCKMLSGLVTIGSLPLSTPLFIWLSSTRSSNSRKRPLSSRPTRFGRRSADCCCRPPTAAVFYARPAAGRQQPVFSGGGGSAACGLATAGKNRYSEANPPRQRGACTHRRSRAWWSVRRAVFVTAAAAAVITFLSAERDHRRIVDCF